ncbi:MULTISPECIES: 3-oxoacyl-[acyl-carrier-protein] synthase III C-terminal domain-containing protein [unclassified Streptomyces]|uniref:type III polyketide synthase n=1 Tax=unclassified Streptomyces TaxID=2593676 RepID=UPI001489F0D8|nr:MULTISPECIES: 3-oxoacyl-[acyl-carrier-protein] synthase III C-terminal domain-containing protein [unclassified Streptomyces]
MTMRVLSVRGALPEHRHRQEEITRSFTTTLTEGRVNSGVVERFHRNVRVATRHTVLPLAEYARLEDFGQSNDVFIRAGVELGGRAVVDALKAVGLTPADVDYIVSCTVTGLAVPSIEARVAAEIGLRPDVVRLPLVGLGCVAGAAGIARLHDLLRGRPDGVAVLMSVELCSLTLQRDDTSVANLVASGLFGDGAAAVVAVGCEHPLAQSDEPTRPEVLASRSRLYPDSERMMGWDVGARGFLAEHGLTGDDIGWYVAHPGGPKVLEALQDALGVERHALSVTWDSLRRIGNLSSSSVLHVLADTLANRPPTPGSYGVLLAMGPGFCSELVLLRAPRGGR